MKYIILSLFSLLAFDICGQVRGIVKDNTGEPILGANIFWLNTGQGVTTKEDGSFSIHKPAKEHMLVVSFIGFQNDTIHVSDKNDELELVGRFCYSSFFPRNKYFAKHVFRSVRECSPWYSSAGAGSCHPVFY